MELPPYISLPLFFGVTLWIVRAIFHSWRLAIKTSEVTTAEQQLLQLKLIIMLSCANVHNNNNDNNNNDIMQCNEQL